MSWPCLIVRISAGIMTGGRVTQKQQNITWSLSDVITRGVMVHQFVLKYLTGHALITAGTTTGAPEIREQEKLGRKTADVTIDITMEDGVIAMVHQCVTQKPQ